MISSPSLCHFVNNEFIFQNPKCLDLFATSCIYIYIWVSSKYRKKSVTMVYTKVFCLKGSIFLSKHKYMFYYVILIQYPLYVNLIKFLIILLFWSLFEIHEKFCSFLRYAPVVGLKHKLYQYQNNHVYLHVNIQINQKDLNFQKIMFSKTENG